MIKTFLLPSQQQIRQLPVFLGRRKRSLNEDGFENFDLIDGRKWERVEGEEEGQELVNHLNHEGNESERSRKLKEEEEIFRLIGTKKGLEEITFELNGKRETFYVAKQVDATLDDLPLEEDESFYSTT